MTWRHLCSFSSDPVWQGWFVWRGMGRGCAVLVMDATTSVSR